MPDSRELDVRYLANLALPFDAQTKQLADGPRIVSGANTYITNGGAIAQAPGLNDTGLTSYTLAGRVDRLWVYETVEAQPKVYIMASVYNGASFDLKYLRLSAGVPAWTSVGSLRGVNASIIAHECVVARGLLFVRFSANNQPAGVIFNGSGGSPTLTSWGLDTPTSAPSYSGNFGVTTTTVIFGWKYAYAYVNNTTGHVSSRSRASVSTGAFSGANPRITGLYTTDTTVTHINIYRTFDGGGTLYFLDQIANNTAGGTFTYNDNASATTAGDSKYDAELDTRNIAPSEVSNNPVPRTITGATTGFPDGSTPLVYFARRHWFAIGNKLFYSGQEEILNGVPEESFPNPFGIRGNYYTLSGQVRQIKAAKRALYINTSDQMMILTGQDKTNFLLDTLAPDVVAPVRHVQGITTFRDTVFFISSDLQIYSITGAGAPQLLSGPLGTQLRSTITGMNNPYVQLEVYSRDGNVWLVVNAYDIVDYDKNRQFVYDLAREIWFTPWAKPINAMTFGRKDELDSQRYLIVTTYNGTTSKLALLDTSYLSDVGTNFVPSAVINLVTVPAGNHINELRKWAHAPMLSYFILERTKFGGDTDPTVAYRLDEFSGGTTAATATDPPYAVQHTSYNEKWYPVQQVCKRVQLSITGTGGQQFEIQNIGFVFQSEAGA